MLSLVQLDIILRQVRKKIISAEDVSDFDKLVGIVPSKENMIDPENLFFRREETYHGSEDTARWPDIEGVVIQFILYKELRAFVGSWGNPDIVRLVRDVVLAQPPINQSQLLCLRVDYNVPRFDIAMDDSLLMAVIQGFQYLEEEVSRFPIR